MADKAYLKELFATKQRLDAGANATPQTAQRLTELKAWQAVRLARTYEDLRADPHCRAAVDFFLTDLYGPQSCARRDADLMRAWDRLERGLPEAALEILARALELQVLSAQLDQAMVVQLGDAPVTKLSYPNAYRSVARAEARQRQIDLVVSIGRDLGRLVEFPLIGLALRAARIPAYLAGFGALQDFLERGYAAFRQLRNPWALLETIRTRETALLHAFFDGSNDPVQPTFYWKP
jgi:hypothetical protein